MLENGLYKKTDTTICLYILPGVVATQLDNVDFLTEEQTGFENTARVKTTLLFYQVLLAAIWIKINIPLLHS